MLANSSLWIKVAYCTPPAGMMTAPAGGYVMRRTGRGGLRMTVGVACRHRGRVQPCVPAARIPRRSFTLGGEVMCHLRPAL